MRVIRAHRDEGAVMDSRRFTAGEVALLSLPCPGASMRSGGAGGQMMTACTFCGEVMASTAGPHSRDGRWYKPVICSESAGGWVAWQSFHEDAPIVDVDIEYVWRLADARAEQIQALTWRRDELVRASDAQRQKLAAAERERDVLRAAVDWLHDEAFRDNPIAMGQLRDLLAARPWEAGA